MPKLYARDKFEPQKRYMPSYGSDMSHVKTLIHKIQNEIKGASHLNNYFALSSTSYARNNKGSAYEVSFFEYDIGNIWIYKSILNSGPNLSADLIGLINTDIDSETKYTIKLGSVGCIQFRSSDREIII